MRIDWSTDSGLILLANDHRTGLWANQTVIAKGKTVRTAGQLPSTAHTHTLFSVSLTHALRSITNRQREQIAINPGQKPKIIVSVASHSFVNAVNGILKNEPIETRAPFRCGGNFKDILFHQLGRFDVEFRRPSMMDKTLLQLGGWMTATMIDKKTIENIPPALAAKAVSTIV